MVGIIHSAVALRDHGHLAPEHAPLLATTLDWLDRNLPTPRQFSFRRAYDGVSGPSDAVCWFKDIAREHLRWACALVALVEDYGVRVSRLESQLPGYIVYEDEFQIAAMPFERARHHRPLRKRR